jgi:hypothetical protein
MIRRGSGPRKNLQIAPMPETTSKTLARLLRLPRGPGHYLSELRNRK